MASDVDVCNLALGLLGDEATVSSIDPPEGSAQAEHCARFFSIARTVLLESHDWSFATKRRVLAETGTPPDSWGFSYALPTDCIRAIAVLNPESTDDTAGQDFEIETDSTGTKLIYTNVEEATLRYTRLVTDMTKYTPLAVNALARLLAFYLAGPVIKGREGMAVAKDMMKTYREIDLPQAAKSDARSRQSNAYTNATPAGILARG